MVYTEKNFCYKVERIVPEKKRKQPRTTHAPRRTHDEIKTEYRKKKSAVVFAIAMIYLVIVAAAAVILDDRRVEIELKGDEEITAEVGGELNDPGAEAHYVGNLFGKGKREVPVTVESDADLTKLGDYTLHYSAGAGSKTAECYRRVHVVDTTPPEITLRHEEGYLASWLVGYSEEGFTATDNYDGDITDRVVRTEVDGRIYYSVEDSSGNETAVVREIEYNISEPMIRLEGGEEIEIGAAFTYTDPGFEAIDGSGNDLSSYVVVTGEVVPWKPGSYPLTYTITNEEGETAVAHRTVNVVAQPPAATIVPDEKTIYLTFDDGPSMYTDRLLDVLSRYDAKATFFVTCCDPDYMDCIGRAFREGHSIGVHTKTHDYYTLYANEQAFFDDFLAVEDAIYEQTGQYTKLFRFPGGSSNTVSRNYNIGIMTRLAKIMTDMGYVYFDWSVDSGDALGGAKTSYAVANNVADGCSEETVSVVLQHDTKGFSVDAVETILRWGRNRGYTFKALDETSYTAHHTIAN